MNAAARLFLILGAGNGLLAVALGAFGAHGLKTRLDATALATYHTGVSYHTTHALALLAVGLALQWAPGSVGLRWSGWLFLAGIVLFSGSLYLLSLTGLRWLGAVTPLGGGAFLAGWLALAIAVAKT